MFQLNETELWRERRQGLLNEAEGERFTLRIGWAAGLRRMLVVMAVAAVSKNPNKGISIGCIGAPPGN